MSKELSAITQVVVATYNPKITLLEKNLRALLLQFENVLVVDDGSKNVADVKKLIDKVGSKIEFCDIKKNMGIAHALNAGYKKSLTRKSKWLLTMDQDSVIPPNLSEEYVKLIDKYDHIGLICWNQRPYKLGSGNEIENDWYIISSGCLNSVEALIECGGFDEKLMIDHVDTDINLKIRNLGYRTITTNNVKLVHEIGKATTRRTLRGAIYHEHSPLRVYYIVRNGIILFRRYFWKQPAWMLRALRNSIREGFYLIYYQPNKFKNFFLIVRAWFDGIFNRLGKFKS
jgi:rhamnosyltransferase